jgi:putative ABC transport system permease protein
MKTELALNKLGVEPAALISQNDLLILSMSIFDRTFAITRALNALTLVVAGVAIFASLLSVYQLRRPEYALWRALGMHWIEFFWVAGFPILLMSAVVMVVSLPMGVILSWLLIHKINVISFGWTMPVVLDAGSIAFLFGVIILLVSTAFLLASLGQRSSVNRALKQLAGE